MKFTQTATTDAVLRELGMRLVALRKRQGVTQEALASDAGVGIATVRRMEDGRDGQLGSWIKVLRALGQEAGLEGLLPQAGPSPMEEALGAVPRRKRAAGQGAGKRGSAFRWGDEAPPGNPS